MKNWPWYGYVLLAVIICGLAFFLYFKPQNTELQRIRAERVKVEDEVRQLQEKKQQLDRIEAELASLNATLRELEKIIPLKKEIDVILRRVQQMAFDSRLDIIKVTPKGEINREFYSEWPWGFEIRGNYHNLASFFDRLSRFARLFIVENFGIKALQAQTDDLTVSATFTSTTFIFLEEGAEPPSSPQTKRRAR
jgi:type IV pilus assembly protein PilO